jgi:hypothetical protein
VPYYLTVSPAAAAGANIFLSIYQVPKGMMQASKTFQVVVVNFQFGQKKVPEISGTVHKDLIRCITSSDYFASSPNGWRS